MDACIDSYLLHLRLERNLSPHTVSSYARDLQRLVQYLPSRTSPETLARNDIERFLAFALVLALFEPAWTCSRQVGTQNVTQRTVVCTDG